MPYDNDGTLVAAGTEFTAPTAFLSGANCIELNDEDYTSVVTNSCVWLFFPETREVTAFYALWGTDTRIETSAIKGSTNSTNGLDGTWETASLPSGVNHYTDAFDWRAAIKPVSFTGGKKVIRLVGTYFASADRTLIMHIYGEKVAGQTPDDIIYINHDDTPGVEYTAPEDFGDQPLGTTVVRQFRVKNASATKTANTINIQCNDSDFAISTDGSTWVATINITSLAAGVESATMYVRCTTPAPGSAIGPRFNRIITTVGSYT
jgi:hypothetical protein